MYINKEAKENFLTSDFTLVNLIKNIEETKIREWM